MFLAKQQGKENTGLAKFITNMELKSAMIRIITFAVFACHLILLKCSFPGLNPKLRR